MTTDTLELPELPKPENEAFSDDCTFDCPEGFSADQMRAYATAAVLAERERCARIAKRFATCPCNGDRGRCLENDVPLAIASAIRNKE